MASFKKKYKKGVKKMKVINEIKNIKMTKVERNPEELSMVTNKIKIEKIETNGDTATASVRIIYKDKSNVVYKVSCLIDIQNNEEAINTFKKSMDEDSNLSNTVITAPLYRMVKSSIKNMNNTAYEINRFYSIMLGK